ncbi:helix-turn-helix transcriptional regulator [Actinoplanes sp. RD1]|uniref:helix-turn-helix transcriptional regulator n=1 Tax=Actinoplanes sp. RD1 TaxID=3064538 RepID=UPI002740B3C3|nr:AraC family transcriptional regulator [Actinoplanes sp. RD1]
MTVAPDKFTRVPGPESRRWRLVSSDRERARHEITRMFGVASLALSAPAGTPFALDLAAARSGPVTTADISYAKPMASRWSGSRGYSILLASHGQAHLRRNNDDVRVDRRYAAALRPGDEVSYRHDGAYRHLLVRVDEAALHRALSALLGADEVHRVALPPELDLTHGPLASWQRLVRQFHHECVTDASLLQYSLIAEHMRHVVVSGMLACLPRVDDAGERSARPARAPSVLRVLDAINAEPERPYTIIELAAIGRVSVRSLQEGFRRQVGSTPTAYLRQVRLSRAHKLLRHSPYGQVTVAMVAHRCGFVHLGRFSAAYRAAYGMNPSQTLRTGT